MVSRIIQAVSCWISSGVGSGYANLAPGTWGSVAALVLWGLLFRIGVVSSATSQVLLIVVTTIVGIAAIGVCLPSESDKDPKWIVIDEWAGLFVALMGLAPGQWIWIGVAFVLFRFFDATKIGPVGWAEQLPGEYGIMADDIVAGVLTLITVCLVRMVVGS